MSCTLIPLLFNASHMSKASKKSQQCWIFILHFAGISSELTIDYLLRCTSRSLHLPCICDLCLCTDLQARFVPCFVPLRTKTYLKNPILELEKRLASARRACKNWSSLLPCQKEQEVNLSVFTSVDQAYCAEIYALHLILSDHHLDVA